MLDPELIALAKRRSGRAPGLVICGDRITNHPDYQHLRGVTPRGWPKGLTWDDAEGAGGARRAIVSVKKELQGGSDSGSVALHELGHTIDSSVQASADPAFLELHAKEVRAGNIPSSYTRTYRGEWFAEQVAKRTVFPKSGYERWGKWPDERNFDQWYQDFLKRNK